MSTIPEVQAAELHLESVKKLHEAKLAEIEALELQLRVAKFIYEDLLSEAREALGESRVLQMRTLTGWHLSQGSRTRHLLGKRFAWDRIAWIRKAFVSFDGEPECWQWVLDYTSRDSSLGRVRVKIAEESVDTSVAVAISDQHLIADGWILSDIEVELVSQPSLRP